jgi:Hg(II)-responsive transcriptional regulator
MHLTIGKLAKEANVGVETVRFYERRGLISEPRRSPSGYRQYLAEDVRRLRFIRRAKAAGFTLVEIHGLLDLRIDGTSNCARVRASAQKKIADIEARSAELARMRAALLRLVKKCRGTGPTSSCPILDAFGSEVRE